MSPSYKVTCRREGRSPRPHALTVQLGRSVCSGWNLKLVNVRIEFNFDVSFGFGFSFDFDFDDRDVLIGLVLYRARSGTLEP